jgi:hypothetical protein
MTITQTVEIPANRRITIEVPREVPTGTTIIAFTPAKTWARKKEPDTVEEALQMLEEQSSNPNRKPISRLFGKQKGIFGGDGVAYQRGIRSEWD